MIREPRGLFEVDLLRDSISNDFSRRGDFLDFLALEERSVCSDLDLGMAEKIQLANKSSSSSPVRKKSF